MQYTFNSSIADYMPPVKGDIEDIQSLKLFNPFIMKILSFLCFFFKEPGVNQLHFD